MKKKFLWGILILFGLIVVLAIFSGGDKTSQQTKHQEVKTENKDDMAKKYQQVKLKMTKDEVLKIMGEPDNKTESEMSGLGKMEVWYYYEIFGKGVMITFENNKVIGKDLIQ